MPELSWEEQRIKAIRENPEKHRHIDLASLANCCFTPEKSFSSVVLDAHREYAGLNRLVIKDVRQEGKAEFFK